MAEVFALSIRWPAIHGEPENSELTDVASFVLDNRADPEKTLAILEAVSRGETYHGGGGGEAPYEVTAVSRQALLEHLAAGSTTAAVIEAARDLWWPDRAPKDFGERQLCAALIRAFGAGTSSNCEACTAEEREDCDECPSQAQVDRFLADCDREFSEHAAAQAATFAKADA